MKRYWAAWFIITFPIGFLIPEIIAIVRNRTTAGAAMSWPTLRDQRVR